MRMWDNLRQLKVVVYEHDLGIIMQNNLMVSKQCAAVRFVAGLGPHDHVTEYLKELQLASDCIPDKV